MVRSAESGFEHFCLETTTLLQEGGIRLYSKHGFQAMGRQCVAGLDVLLFEKCLKT